MNFQKWYLTLGLSHIVLSYPKPSVCCQRSNYQSSIVSFTGASSKSFEFRSGVQEWWRVWQGRKDVKAVWYRSTMIYCTIQSWHSHQWRLLSRCRRCPLFPTASQRPIVPTIWVFSHKPEALHLTSGCPSYGHKSARETGIKIESCGGSMKYYTLSNQTKQNTQR